MSIKQKIQGIIKSSLDNLEVDVELDKIVIETPKEAKNGDYSTNIALVLTKILKDNPMNIASKIANEISDESIKRVEVAPPGFINIYLAKEVLLDEINKIIQEDKNYGKNTTGNNKKINLEYVSANPTGTLHIGHGRGATYGDNLSRILSFCGYDVTREYYINDAGNQMNNLGISIKERYREICGLECNLPEDGYHGKEIITIAKQIYDTYKDSKLEEDIPYFKQEGLNILLDAIKKDLDRFRVNFDVFTSEQSLYDQGEVETVLNSFKKNNNCYISEDALWLKTSEYGDEKDRVIVKNDGNYTYLLPDIAYHVNKINRGYQQLIDVLGADHHGYIARMKAAIQALGHEANKLEIELVQMVRLIKDGQEMKMSKRTGNAVTIRELCEEVGTDAVRYYFVARSASSHLDFDLDLASSTSSENPVYYAQYAHARTCQILELAKKNNLVSDASCSHLEHQKEIDLMKFLATFPDVVLDAALSFTPSKVTNYTQKLAQLFHAFYNECKVIDLSNIEVSQQRLALVEASRITMRNALDLVGVNAPNKM